MTVLVRFIALTIQACIGWAGIGWPIALLALTDWRIGIWVRSWDVGIPLSIGIYAVFMSFVFFTRAAIECLDINLGARAPSPPEAAQIAAAEKELAASYREKFGQTLKPIRWRVIDQDSFTAMAYGRDSIGIARDLLQYAEKSGPKGKGVLQSLMAHELSHLQNGDAIIPYVMTLLNTPISWLRGLMLLVLEASTGPKAFIAIIIASVIFVLVWPAMLVRRFCWFLLGLVSTPAEYRADHFSCRLAGKEGLLDFLDLSACLEPPSGESVLIYYARNHPPIELRQARIRNFLVTPDQA